MESCLETPFVILKISSILRTIIHVANQTGWRPTTDTRDDLPAIVVLRYIYNGIVDKTGLTEVILKRNYSWTMAVILLAVAIIFPRITAGTLLVKYDILFWNNYGGGYTTAVIAFITKIVSFLVAIYAIYEMIRYPVRRTVWAIILVISVSSLLSVSFAPREQDITRVIERGNRLIALIESYHKEHREYPSNLAQLQGVPQTGLVKGRRFFYVTAHNELDDKGNWFPGTRKYLEKSPYVICVPLVPGGTLVYRPDGKYTDLPGSARQDGWYGTSID